MSGRAPLKRGARLGPYTLVEPVGQGATAWVYLAYDGDGRTFAVKVREPGSQQADRRFLREFESMRSVRIPGVVRVHHAGIDGDILWFSMDRVLGQHFDAAVAAAPTVAARIKLAVRLGRQMLETLGHLHDAGFVHRDVKPSNVLVDTFNAVHVLDFGIVRFFADHDSTTTRGGEVLGTVPYMAPEQVAGLPIDERIDVFSAGVMLWEAVCGPRPRPATTIGWIPRICLERLAPVATIVREAPRGLSHLIEGLLAVDPRDRPTAAEASRALRKIEASWPSDAWPEPVWQEPDRGLGALEGCIGNPLHPAVQVLEGPTGAGKRRLAEQIHRQALLQSVWPLHLHCRVDRLGGPLEEFLEVLLRFSRDDSWVRMVLGDDAETLRRMWPTLPLPVGLADAPMPSLDQVATAFAQVVARVASRRAMVVVVHDLERVDPLTARALPKLAQRAHKSLGLLVLHDRRFPTTASHQVVTGLQTRHGAGVTRIQPLPAELCSEIAGSLCPEGPRPSIGSRYPQEAVEAGWRALAEWRGEAWEPPSARLWPLAVRDGAVPVDVVEELVGPGVERLPGVVEEDDALRLADAGTRRAVRSRMKDLPGAARALVESWRRFDRVAGGGATDPSAEVLPELLLIAGDVEGAWHPTAAAAAEAESAGRLTDARRWLFLLDSLPAPAELDVERAFQLAVIRARVALRTEVDAPRVRLVEACERLARTEVHEQEVRLVQAELALRDGQVRSALVAALRVAATGSDVRLAVRGHLLAAQCRMLLDQPDEVPRTLERAAALLRRDPDPRLAVQHANWEAEFLLHERRLVDCRQRSQQVLRDAAACGDVRAAAMAAARLGRVLRELGRRREAETELRTALRGFAVTGDVVLDTDASLQLAALLVERGDVAGGRHMLDGAVRRIRLLQLPHLLPTALRVALQAATQAGDPAEATMALSELSTVAEEPEAAAAIARWWRTRGDIDRAQSVDPPTREGYGRVLWRIERARAALAGGHLDAAEEDAITAAAEADAAGLAELAIYARLVAGAAGYEPADWAQLLTAAGHALSVDVCLGALEMEARRLHRRGMRDEATERWRTLLARSRELGYGPGVEEAQGWLAPG